MALGQGMLKANAGSSNSSVLGFLRQLYVAAAPPPMNGSIISLIAPPQSVLPQFNPNPDNRNKESLDFGFPGFSFGGSMELMAVPKKKVSPHKRGIRNGPKALKPIPVIVRCRACGKVKLPHYYCCSGDRGNPNEQNK